MVIRAPDWRAWEPCATSTDSAGSVRLHAKVAQQFRQWRKRAGSIMEDYAWLCINGRIGNVLNSA